MILYGYLLLADILWNVVVFVSQSRAAQVQVFSSDVMLLSLQTLAYSIWWNVINSVDKSKSQVYCIIA